MLYIFINDYYYFIYLSFCKPLCGKFLCIILVKLQNKNKTNKKKTAIVTPKEHRDALNVSELVKTRPWIQFFVA